MDEGDIKLRAGSGLGLGPGHAPRRLGQGPGYFWKKFLGRGSAWMRANICEVSGIKLWTGAPATPLGGSDKGRVIFGKKFLSRHTLAEGLIYATWTRLPRVTSSDRARVRRLGQGWGARVRERERLYFWTCWFSHSTT